MKDSRCLEDTLSYTAPSTLYVLFQGIFSVHIFHYLHFIQIDMLSKGRKRLSSVIFVQLQKYFLKILFENIYNFYSEKSLYMPHSQAFRFNQNSIATQSSELVQACLTILRHNDGLHTSNQTIRLNLKIMFQSEFQINWNKGSKQTIQSIIWKLKALTFQEESSYNRDQVISNKDAHQGLIQRIGYSLQERNFKLAQIYKNLLKYYLIKLEQVETEDQMQKFRNSQYYKNKFPILRFHLYDPKEHIVRVLENQIQYLSCKQQFFGQITQVSQRIVWFYKNLREKSQRERIEANLQQYFNRILKKYEKAFLEMNQDAAQIQTQIRKSIACLANYTKGEEEEEYAQNIPSQAYELDRVYQTKFGAIKYQISKQLEYNLQKKLNDPTFQIFIFYLAWKKSSITLEQPTHEAIEDYYCKKVNYSFIKRLQKASKQNKSLSFIQMLRTLEKIRQIDANVLRKIKFVEIRQLCLPIIQKFISENRQVIEEYFETQRKYQKENSQAYIKAVNNLLYMFRQLFKMSQEIIPRCSNNQYVKIYTEFSTKMLTDYYAYKEKQQRWFQQLKFSDIGQNIWKKIDFVIQQEQQIRLIRQKMQEVNQMLIRPCFRIEDSVKENYQRFFAKVCVVVPTPTTIVFSQCCQDLVMMRDKLQEIKNLSVSQLDLLTFRQAISQISKCLLKLQNKKVSCFINEYLEVQILPQILANLKSVRTLVERHIISYQRAFEKDPQPEVIFVDINRRQQPIQQIKYPDHRAVQDFVLNLRFISSKGFFLRTKGDLLPLSYQLENKSDKINYMKNQVRSGMQNFQEQKILLETQMNRLKKKIQDLKQTGNQENDQGQNQSQTNQSSISQFDADYYTAQFQESQAQHQHSSQKKNQPQDNNEEKPEDNHQEKLADNHEEKLEEQQYSLGWLNQYEMRHIQQVAQPKNDPNITSQKTTINDAQKEQQSEQSRMIPESKPNALDNASDDNAENSYSSVQIEAIQVKKQYTIGKIKLENQQNKSIMYRSILYIINLIYLKKESLKHIATIFGKRQSTDKSSFVVLEQKGDAEYSEYAKKRSVDQTKQINKIWSWGSKAVLTFIYCIAFAIAQLEQIGIFHNDIFFRNTIRKNGDYKVIDFDHAYEVNNGNHTREMFGSWLSNPNNNEIIKDIFQPRPSLSNRDANWQEKLDSIRISQDNKQTKINSCMKLLRLYMMKIHYWQLENLVSKLLEDSPLNPLSSKSKGIVQTQLKDLKENIEKDVKDETFDKASYNSRLYRGFAQYFQGQSV